MHFSACPQVGPTTVAKHGQVCRSGKKKTDARRQDGSNQYTIAQIRSTMSENRFDALVLMQAQRKRVIAMSNDDIVKKFA